VQAVLEFVHPLLALAALSVVIVFPLAVGGTFYAGTIGHHEAQVGAFLMALGFANDLAFLVPGIALIVEALKKPLLLFRLRVALDRLLHQRFGELFEPGIGGKAEGVGEVVFFADLIPIFDSWIL
jgi:hypothetical protein